MFKRIKIALLEPKQIGQFLKDKKRVVFGYILFLLLIASIPLIIKNTFTKELNSTFKNNFKTAINNSEYLLNIVDGKLVNEEEIKLSVLDEFNGFSVNFEYSIYNIDANNFSIYIYNFTEEGIDFYISFSLMESYKYGDLGLSNIDFSNKEDVNKVLRAFDMIYLYNKSNYNFLSFLSFYFGELFLSLVFILISMLIYRLQPIKLKRKYRFILSTYSYTMYYFSILLENLYNVPYIKLIGIAISLFYLRIAYNHLILVSKISIKEDKIE